MSRGTSEEVRCKRPGSLMGTAEVEDYLGVPRSTITRWLQSGKMPAPLDKPRASPIWDRKDIERFQRKRESERIPA